MLRRLPLLVAVLSVCAMLAYLALLPTRLTYAYELEWQEGSMLAHLLRLREGKPLYAAPTLEFISFPYPPLFHWVAACLARWTGPELSTLRLVSVIASLGVLGIVGLHVRSTTGSVLGGLVAAGLFAGAYGWGGAWLDVGRVDSLALFLGLASYVLAQRSSGMQTAGAAGVLGALAVLTKQTMLLPCCGLALGLWLVRRKLGLGYGLGLVVLAGGGFLGLHHTSQGWSSYFLFEQLGRHPWHGPGLWEFWSRDMLSWGPALIALGIATGSAGGQAAETTKTTLPLAGWSIGLLLASWLGRMHLGGYDNTLLPAALACSLLVGRHVGISHRRSRSHVDKLPVGFAAVLVAVALQWVVLFEDPRVHLPSEADRTHSERVVQSLSQVQGPVFAPYSPYLAAQAGHGWSAHAMGFFDLSAAGAGPICDGLFAELERAFEQERFGAVLLSEAQPFTSLFKGHYGPQPDRDFVGFKATPLPVSGASNGPRLLYHARPGGAEPR